MKFASLTLALVALWAFSASGQTIRHLELEKSHADLGLGKHDLKFVLTLKKGSHYQITVLQQKIDAVVILADTDGKTIKEEDSPTGSSGPEEFEFEAKESRSYFLIIRRLEEAGNPERGNVTITVKTIPPEVVAKREQIKKELAPENAKTVQTIDIDHFWEAFDMLTNCKTSMDSVRVFQEVYLDRGTDGLHDFIRARNFTAEKFVRAVKRFPKFYASIRKNTLAAKNAAPVIEEVFNNFRALYPNFKPFKVCFAIGFVQTGGTVSSDFVMIGSEISTCTQEIDLSEFNNNAISKVMATGTDVVQKIKNIVAHECVHTQQITPGNDAVRCFLLYRAMQEGFCDFVGELVAGSQINIVAQTYGKAHEEELWSSFKKDMCGKQTDNWLYNYGQSKDKPADLGYFIGYAIAKEYYRNASDKKQAIIDIIEMQSPEAFLKKSGYETAMKE